MQSDNSIVSWLKLAAVRGIGETLRCGLIQEFGSPEGVFKAKPSELSMVKGWSPGSFERFPQELSNARPICDPEMLDKKGIRIITFNDPEFPPSLREIPDAPIVLFAIGKIIPDHRPHIAIVGARNGSQQGFDIAREFAYELAKAGFVIVSGLALGIDTFSHKGALEANSRTIAVLGCGVDVVYPTSNRKIRDSIEQTGMIVSEFPPETPPKPWHFPIRNRIISGMSVGILVVEASARSGSLITARLGIEQDRDVFAIPGGIRSKLAEGTLSLLQEGASIVTSPQDIVDHYAHLIPQPEKNDREAILLDNDENELLSFLEDEPISIEKLLMKNKWPREKLFSLLLNLEMRNILVKYPGNLFQSKIKLSSAGDKK
ncbi:MAG: DNA-protecting protein DprA [Candidatus Riflebacteria bacterium]|nr:DNA-protecting protein DprA [Candidatus Riflebacteria bacterium]